MQTLTVEKKKEEINEYQKELDEVTEQMENLCVNSIEIYIKKILNVLIFFYTNIL